MRNLGLSFLAAMMALFGLLSVSTPLLAQTVKQTKGSFVDKFRQLEGEDWPTPTDYRNAAGEPGHRYWQQQADYDIKVSLDEAGHRITGSGTLTYKNNSPDSLRYIWFLLEQNKFRRDSLAELTETVGANQTLSVGAIRRAKRMKEWQGGFESLKVMDANGAAVTHQIVDTMMRVDLKSPLKSGESISLQFDWSYPLIETRVVGGRAGYECFTKPGEDGQCLFLVAQWFPRVAVYSDYEGWHNKAFLGTGEFTLEFGNYKVAITVPSDHIVSSTGVLTNPDILTPAQRARLEQAKSASKPVYIVTPDEALKAALSKPSGTKTWVFEAENVRDFAFASSRKFVWDAQGVKNDHPDHPVVMAMSFYPNEARPLWDAYSTKAIAHTLRVYGKYAFPYPYPTAQSVNGPVGGMEYPMITFNGPRPIRDKKTGALTYTERAKYGLIGVVIHEVGHIWFPMAVNSDERQWTWMDEGINSYLQYLAQMEWEETWPNHRGEPRNMVDYMLSENQMPIMTNSESIAQLGNNSYGKPATALVILRETIVGREAFDTAFKEYSRRWAFKRPTPFDFFRTIEEVSGVDLDWYWRGWFYSTDHVDIELKSITHARLNTRDPRVEKAFQKAEAANDAEPLTAQKNRAPTVTDADPEVRDFYNETDRFTVFDTEIKKYETAKKDWDPELEDAMAFKDNFYNFTFVNKGGLVMPVILKIEFTDGTNEIVRIPAEVWRMNPSQAIWQFVTPKTIRSALIDPVLETADADRANNSFPRLIDTKTFGVTEVPELPNRMRDADKVVSPDSIKANPKPAPPKAK